MNSRQLKKLENKYALRHWHWDGVGPERVCFRDHGMKLADSRERRVKGLMRRTERRQFRQSRKQPEIQVPKLRMTFKIDVKPFVEAIEKMRKAMIDVGRRIKSVPVTEVHERYLQTLQIIALSDDIIPENPTEHNIWVEKEMTWIANDSWEKANPSMSKEFWKSAAEKHFGKLQGKHPLDYAIENKTWLEE